jgi:hypothetical protein
VLGKITVVFIEIDTLVIKKMVLQEGEERGKKVSERRGMRHDGYRVIRP